jgi:hypothetical protein
MEANLPSPIIRAREELELEEEREKDVGAICALGFEREQVLDALEETVGVKLYCYGLGTEAAGDLVFYSW